MAFFNIDNQIKRRQMELAEREQRLQNDPGRIFLKSLASSAPKALFNALGSVGVNLATGAANYNLFGGKERSEAQIRASEAKIAETYPQLRRQFFDKNYKGVAPATGQPKAVQQAKDQIQKPPMPIKMPDMVDMGDGTVAVEIPTEGLTVKQIEQQGLVSDPNLESLNRAVGPERESLGSMLGPRTEMDKILAEPSAGQKMYKIVSQKEANRIKLTHDELVAAARGDGISQFIAPGDQLPTPESLKKLRQTGDLTRGLAGSPYPLTSGELKKLEELNSLERRKVAELTASQRKKRQDLIKAQLTEEIKNSYNYMALSSAEQLAQKKQSLLERIRLEQDPVLRDVYLNAYESMPKESQRAEAERLFRENKGTVSVGSVRIGERNKVVVNYNEKPTRLKVKDAAMDAQSEIYRLDDILADPARSDEHAYAAKQRRAMLTQLKDYSEMENVLTPILLDPETGYLIVKASEESVVGRELDRPPAGGLTARTNAFNADKKRSYDSIGANPKAQEMFTKKVNDKRKSGMGVEAAREEAAIEMIDANGLLRPDLRGPGSGAGKPKKAKPSYPNLEAKTSPGGKKGGQLDYALELVREKRMSSAELATLESKAADLSPQEVDQAIAGALGITKTKEIPNRMEEYFKTLKK